MSNGSFAGPSAAEQKRMLERVGARNMDDLFSGIPAPLQTDAFAVPEGLTELEMSQRLRTLAARNATGLTNFCGAGFYDHFIPAAVDSLSGRGEFFTAYTPYQPEASQGTLQAIYEYQTSIVRLTDMEVANASLYDGGTALFEAITMAMRCTRRNKVIVCEGLNPIYRNMLRCYTRTLPLEVVEVPLLDGRSDRNTFAGRIDRETAAVLLSYPNFLGCVDDIEDLVSTAREAGALAIVSVYPAALGLFRTPGEIGADIVVGEGQSLGLPLSFGGPYLGFMATRKKWVRRMPGRVVGATRDAKGRRGFVLTLQTREQHIRREKATSNICSNEALCALRAVIFLSLLGRQGFKEWAETCAARAAYACKRLCAIPGVKRSYPHPFFNEFSLDLPANASDIVGRLLRQGVAAGFPLGRYYPGQDRSLLVAVTEKRTREEIDHLADRLQAALQGE